VAAHDPHPVGDLGASLASVAVSLRDDVPRDRVLAALSDVLQPVLPHDRLVVDALDENGRTFRVFAEHVVRGPVCTRTTTRPTSSARRATRSRSGPSLTPGAYTEGHVTLGRHVADHIAPAVDNAVLRPRERRRRERMTALERLPVVPGSTLNVKEVFERVAETVRPAMDFDVMGVGIVTPSGRDIDVIAEVNPEDQAHVPTPRGCRSTASRWRRACCAARP